MTPEEAKPRDFDDLFEEGWKFKVGRIDGAGWFTAKEAAEIAKAYAYSCVHGFIDSEDEKVRKFDKLFEEWSK